MDFVTGLPILTNLKGDSYDSILVIVNRLTKMVYYKRVKVTINAPGLAEVIIYVVVGHCGGRKAKTANTSLTQSPYFPAASMLAYFIRL